MGILASLGGGLSLGGCGFTPKMAGILGEGLIRTFDGMKAYMMHKFPTIKGTYIGVNFNPLGDLSNMVGCAVIIVVACKGNIFKTFIVGIPTIIAKLHIASSMAEVYTKVAKEVSINIGSHIGNITVFFRWW